MLTLQVSKPWHIFSPVVYRYMDQEYVDDFFENGRLRLSPFKSYASFEDPVRGDKGEGSNFRTGISHEGEGMTLMALTFIGDNALSFCTSLILSQELNDAFESTGVFRIKDTKQFGVAVANRLAGFREGMEGPCIYVKRRSTTKEMKKFDLDDLKIAPDKKELSMDKMFEKINDIGGPEEMFMKPLIYQKQAEYRFLWLMAENCKEHVMVECPEAVQFCERVETAV